MMRTTRYIHTLLALSAATLVALSAAPAFAGGPLAVCESGTPYLWPNGGTNIVFNPDQGNLGPLTGAQAIAAVDASFQVWEDIPTATMTYSQGALLPVDVDVTNFGPYLNAPAPDGLSAVVFDDDGQIFDLLFGPGSGILGFAGPEWVNTVSCEILEGLSFLNGPSFTDATAAFDVMVHEFGHWTNFAHTVVNGQIYLGSVGGDNTGPTPHDTFGPPPNPFTDIIETMYPFYYGPGIGTGSLEADDVAIASTMYPDPSFLSTGSISGTILFGTNRITGVNVIARNVADPFNDAVSAISSDFTDSTSQGDPVVGTYRINGLTPGADYGVYVDEILAGGFSTTPASPLPGPEDLYNGADESSDPSIDDPSVFETVTASSVGPVTGIDILFNLPAEGDPLPVGDDGSVQLPLPFTFTVCDQDFASVFVNANGNLTFGAGDSDFTESAAEMLDGPPRIAGVWDDLSPFNLITGAQQGTVFYTTTNNTFTVTWEDVPEFLNTGANTFSIELKQDASQAELDYGDLTVADGLAGVSCGIFATSGTEAETELRTVPNQQTANFNGQTAVYEWFSENDNDLADYTVTLNTAKHKLKDVFEKNGSIKAAEAVPMPFNTSDNDDYTDIYPPAADVDYFSFTASAGQTLVAEVTRGQIDSVLGVFDSGGTLIGFNDDFNGLLSRVVTALPADGTYYLAVTFCCDYDFDGVDPGQGAPFDLGRYVLDAQVVDGVPITLGDDASVNVGLGFSFPYQGGSHNDVFVNSNGNLTFGSGDTDFSESVGELLNDQPRIAPLWDDLSPNNGGLVTVDGDGSSFLTVRFLGVPEFLTTGANTFAVTLESSGLVTVNYGSVTALDGIVGLTQGGGAADPGETDFSAGGPFSAAGTTYEQFTGGADPFDLGGATLDFNP